MTILDQYGDPIQSESSPKDLANKFMQLRRELQEWRSGKRDVNAYYDGSRWSEHNEGHWSNVDYRSPNSANDYQVRRILRARSRYEVIENNSYIKGMALTICNDFVGSGPKINVIDRRISATMRRLIEDRFRAWSEEIKLRQLVWRMRMARLVDGEAFGLEYTNRRIRNQVNVDWQSIEADQVTTMHVINLPEENQIDGIMFDDHHQPTKYYVLKYHPGEIYGWYGNIDPGEWLDERFILHWFRQDRPWLRGIPEVTPCLPLCSILRRYTLAVLQAAETGADFAAILKTIGPALPGNWGSSGPTNTPGDYEAFDTFPIDKGMITTMPHGYDITQLKAEQPTTVYDAFVDAILREIARCLNIPFNIAVGFSGGYNLASGTLDRQLYQGSIDRDRDHFEDYVLNKIFEHWWFEAIRIPDYLGQGLSALEAPPQHKWRWDRKPEHADPAKVAQAIKTLHEINVITDDQIQGERMNRDLDEYYEALEQQRERREAAGYVTPGTQSNQPSSPPEGNGEGEPEFAEENEE